MESLLERHASGPFAFRLQDLHYVTFNMLISQSFGSGSLGWPWAETALISDAYTLLEKIEVLEANFEGQVLGYLPGRFWHIRRNLPFLTWGHVWCSLVDIVPLLEYEFELFQNAPRWINSSKNRMEFLVHAEKRLLDILLIPKVRQFLECVRTPEAR